MGRIVQISGVARPTKVALKIGRIGMCGYAKEFLHAALKAGSLPVRAHLLGHSLELYLKVWLLNRGRQLNPLTRSPFGHNIANILYECIKQGIGQDFKISPQLQTDIIRFSDIYASKGLEYFSLAFLFVPPKLPPLDRIQRFVAQLDKEMLKKSKRAPEHVGGRDAGSDECGHAGS